MSDTPALPIWKCDFAQEQNGHPLNNLTVGSKFKMNCHGDIPVEWNRDNVGVAFKDKKSEEYTLFVLNANKLAPNDAELTVTGYKAGQFKPEFVRIIQGDHGFEVMKPEWEIRTVLKQNEQPKPYAPYGPWGVGLPLWFMIFIGVLVGLVTFFVIRFVRRRMQRQKMLRDLALHATAISAVNQFYKDSRQIKRKLDQAQADADVKDMAVQLDKEFRLFVLRQFQVPALDWSDRAIVDDIRKRQRRDFDLYADPLRKALRELTRIKARNTVSVTDAEQLHQICLDAVEAVGGTL
jgi:hypothetical protein